MPTIRRTSPQDLPEACDDPAVLNPRPGEKA
jgi:hypothetical protein